MENERIQSVDMVYATALVEMAQSAGKLDLVAEEMSQLGELLAQDADLRRLLESRILSIEERAAAIDRIFNGQVSDLVYRFLQVVNRKNRLNELSGIVRAFHKLFAEHKGIVEVDAYVADKLDSAKLEAIAAAVGRVLGKQVVPHQHVDETLIGGLKLRIGDRLLDGSVATQLKLVQQKIQAAGREKARGGAAITE